MIYIFTGNGPGKTTAALGLALRSLGHGLKVVIIQFLKGRKDIGEYKIGKKLGPRYQIYQFGRKDFINLKKPESVDFKLAQNGLNFAKQILKNRKPDLLILDEINLAAKTKILPLKEVLKFLKTIPRKTNVVLTGNPVPKEFIKLADGVSEIRKIKHPFNKGVKAIRGLEY